MNSLGLAITDQNIHRRVWSPHTQMHKVVVLQDFLNVIVWKEDLSTPALQHAEPLFPLSVLATFGLIEPPQGIGGQSVDRGGRVTAWNPEPLPTDTHWHKAHRLAEGQTASQTSKVLPRTILQFQWQSSEPPTIYGKSWFVCEWVRGTF